jgi:ribose 5-phosphate isomerase B
MIKTIAIGCDHAGYEYKEALVPYLKQQGYEVFDFGTNSPVSVDYPDYVHPVCKAIEQHKADIGILLCGSANGVCITANKYAHIRAALCWMKEIAELARQHNNANVLCIPARFTALEQTKGIVYTFLNTNFEGGRHQTRVEKINPDC